MELEQNFYITLMKCRNLPYTACKLLKSMCGIPKLTRRFKFIKIEAFGSCIPLCPPMIICRLTKLMDVIKFINHMLPKYRYGRCRIFCVSYGEYLINDKTIKNIFNPMQDTIYLVYQNDDDVIQDILDHNPGSKRINFGINRGVTYYNVHNIISLNLKGTNLKILPESISKLIQLQNLRISSNPIDNLTNEICKCKQLNTLDISYTSISKLPNDITKLTNLRKLNIIDLQIEFIPSQLYKTCEIMFTSDFVFNYEI